MDDCYFRNEKSFENFCDARVSVCACAKVRDQYFWPSSTFGCAWSNSIVPGCVRSVKFLCVRVQCCIALVSLGFPQSISIASCVFICARSNFFMFSRNDAWFFKLWISQSSDKKSDVFFRSQKLVKKRAELINSNTKTRSTQKFKHENLKRTKRVNL